MGEKFDVRDRRDGNWFWCQNIMLKSKIPHTYKLTYFSLCSYANKNTEKCYPGMRRLAEIAGISSRSVLRAIECFEKAGILKIEKNKGRVNQYILLNLTTDNMSLVTQTARNQCHRRHKTSDPRETKQTKGTNEINNRGLNLLREKMKEIHIKAFPN
jgi:DNA-binding transcriptional regulator YhcF (GntR family)